MRLGVISDTHDYLDPRVRQLFARVDHILHAGDIGMPIILLELEEIAPVTAVGGNTDDPALRYHQTRIVDLADRKFLLHHIVNPHSQRDPINTRIARERPSAVVFGHTHKPFCETLNGTLFFNPGYAGKHRFNLERSVAILHCSPKEIRPEYFPL
jgi:uncharacterized protein